MQYKLLILLNFCASFICAQVSGDMTTDTLLAHQYMQQVQQLPPTSEQKLVLATKALDLYKAYPELPKFLAAKSLLAEVTYDTAPETAYQLATEVIEQAESQLGNVLHPYTFHAYITLMDYEGDYTKNYKKAIALGEALEAVVPPSSDVFLT